LKNGVNPLVRSTRFEATGVENHLESHPSSNVERLAQLICENLKKNTTANSANSFTPLVDPASGRCRVEIGSGGGYHSNFIGAMPCNFHRKDLTDVIDNSNNFSR